MLKVSTEVSYASEPYSSVPARESVAGFHVLPSFTRRTSVHPPPSIDSDQSENVKEKKKLMVKAYDPFNGGDNFARNEYSRNIQ